MADYASLSPLNRRDFLSLVAAGAAGAGLAGCQRAFSSMSRPNRPPNILLIMADDLSAHELGCYGHPEHRTPVLDELARTGAYFNTCWSTPLCRPTRAMIMTGRYAHRTGWYHNYLMPLTNEAGRDLSATNLIFAKVLQSAGYATAIADKWQLWGDPADYGFDQSCISSMALDPSADVARTPPISDLPNRVSYYWKPGVVINGRQRPVTERDYGPDICTDFLIDFMRANRDGPFLAYFPTHLTHKSWDSHNQRDGYVTVPERGPDGQPTGRPGAATLKSNVEYLDYLVGRLVGALDELGVRQNTLVLFTTDNGTSGYGKGSTVLEKGLRVPMITNGPGLVEPLGRSDALVDLSDVMPTMLDYAGAPLPADYEIDGVSFAPILRGRAERTRDHIFSYLLESRWVRDERYLLDGQGRLYDTGGRRDNTDYRDVTDATDPAVAAARRRFEAVLARYPLPDPESAMYRHHVELQRQREQERRRARDLRQADPAAP